MLGPVNLTLRQLEYVVAVAERLHFRQAAEDCSVSQPALSSQIRELEQSLGLVLFERDRRKVLLTPEGEEVARRAREILAAARDLEGFAASKGPPLCGRIRLGVIPTIAPYLLPGALPVVRSRYPELRLFLTEGRTEDLVEAVSRGELDVALLAREAELGDLTVHDLFVERFEVAMWPGHELAGRESISVGDLEGQELLLLEDGHCLSDQALEFCSSSGLDGVLDFRASSLATLVQMVASGTGLTFLPEMARDVECRAPDELVVRPMAEGTPRRTISFAWRSSSSRVQEFELLAECFGSGRR